MVVDIFAAVTHIPLCSTLSLESSPTQTILSTNDIKKDTGAEDKTAEKKSRIQTKIGRTKIKVPRIKTVENRDPGTSGYAPTIQNSPLSFKAQCATPAGTTMTSPLVTSKTIASSGLSSFETPKRSFAWPRKIPRHSWVVE